MTYPDSDLARPRQCDKACSRTPYPGAPGGDQTGSSACVCDLPQGDVILKAKFEDLPPKCVVVHAQRMA